MITSSTEIASTLQRYNVSTTKTATQDIVTKSVSSIEDKVTISPDSFRVETNVEDYLPQSRDLKKKNFKNVKEYAEYLLMLLMKLRDLKPKPGELKVKMEDKAELQKIISDLGSAKLV